MFLCTRKKSRQNPTLLALIWQLFRNDVSFLPHRFKLFLQSELGGDSCFAVFCASSCSCLSDLASSSASVTFSRSCRGASRSLSVRILFRRCKYVPVPQPADTYRPPSPKHIVNLHPRRLAPRLWTPTHRTCHPGLSQLSAICADPCQMRVIFRSRSLFEHLPYPRHLVACDV